MSDSVIHINIYCHSKFSEKNKHIYSHCDKKGDGSVKFKGLKAFYTTNVILIFFFISKNNTYIFLW